MMGVMDGVHEISGVLQRADACFREMFKSRGSCTGTDDLRA
jgi:hypothetical protein